MCPLQKLYAIRGDTILIPENERYVLLSIPSAADHVAQQDS